MIQHPSVYGQSGKSSTIVLALIILLLWMSITGRLRSVKVALNAKSPLDIDPYEVPPLNPTQGPGGGWGVDIGQLPGIDGVPVTGDPGMHGPIGGKK